MSEKQSLEVFLEEKNYDFEVIAPEFACLGKLEEVPQDAIWHGEGNVLEHTRRVCRAVKEGAGWQRLNRWDKAVLYMAVLFHDLGKLFCTTVEEGRIISPNHSMVGMRRFREYCYREMEERFEIPFHMREEIAWLIRYHGLPLLFLEKEPVEYYVVRAAESVRIDLLYELGRADVLGRVCSDRKSALDTVEYFKTYAIEIGCFGGKAAFANAYTRFTYFKKRDMWIGDHLYDNTEFDVYVMSGLPLVGKDTYVEQILPEVPVISLDEIRAEMGIRSDEPSGPVVAIAKERAKVFLRSKRPFVWNATNVLLDTRQKVCRMGTDYGARVNLIYCEAPYRELLRRNQIRERTVPVDVISHLIRKLDVPECVEAYRVIYPDAAERNSCHVYRQGGPG